MIQTNITGLSEGLRSSEASDVKFVASKNPDNINTLHIVWDTEPTNHKGMYIKASELGAPDPTLFEAALLQFFYMRAPLEGVVPWKCVNCQFVYSISIDDDERLKPLFPSIKRAIRRYDANLGGFEDSMLGVENTFKNIQMILKYSDISQAKNTFRAALLLSAGPSLDQEWDEIRRAISTHKFLVISCDAVIKKALKVGVRPHIVMTTERVPGSEDFLNGMTADELKGITLVSTLMAYGPTISGWNGNKAFTVRKDYPAHWYPFKNREFIWSAPSVAPTCLGVLGLLGIKSVALVGQDLCLDEKGNSHTSLSDSLVSVQKEMERQEKVRAEQDREEVETYSNQKRMTTNTWNVMRGDLTTVAQQWKQSVVSTSWHGSVIREIPYQSLTSWIDERLSGTPDGKIMILNKNPNESYELARFQSKRKTAIEYLKELEDNLEKYTPDEIIELPHFRELCLTSCQRSYVTYTNKRFQRSEDKHEFKTLFRGEALLAIREVIEILEKE